MKLTDANGQILAQHDGGHTAKRYFYLHDRLGSVRQIVNSSGNVVRLYTYEPFGQALENEGTLTNPFMFTGQYRDSETDFDYLRARIYYPYIQRFISADPVTGQFENPLTLHAYLYCINDPVNKIDLIGLLYTPVGGPNYKWETTQEIIERATELVGSNFVEGPIQAFGLFGRGGIYDYKFSPFTFNLTENVSVVGSEFSNWLAGYACYYNYGLVGDFSARRAGHRWAQVESGRPDEPASRYFISAGVLKAMADRFAEGRHTESEIGTFVGAKSQLRMYGYNRLLGEPFERTFGGITQIVSADLASDEWWDQAVMFAEFWNAGPMW